MVGTGSSKIKIIIWASAFRRKSKKRKRYSRKIAYHNLSRDLEFSNIDLLKCDIEGAKLNSSKTIVHHYKLLKILLLKHMVKVRKILFCKKLDELGFSRCLNAKNEEDAIFSNLFFKKNRN